MIYLPLDVDLEYIISIYIITYSCSHVFVYISLCIELNILVTEFQGNFVFVKACSQTSY